MQSYLMFPTPRIGVVSGILVVEGHTGTDDIDQGNTFVANPGFDQFFDLFGVASEGTRDKCCTADQSFPGDVNRHVRIDTLVLQAQPDFCGGRKLAFGQTVNAVVFDDINHRRIAAHSMFELSHANASRVAITGETDTAQASIAKQCAGRNGGHTTVQTIEAE